MSANRLTPALAIAVPSTPSALSAPRASRFTEGVFLTGPEALSPDTPSHTLLFSILSEMDEHEHRRRQRTHRDSQSSVSSIFSTTYSGTSSPPRDGRRSIAFTGRSTELQRRSTDDTPNRDEKSKGGFKGRLRALTGGGRDRSGSGKVYTGS